MLLVPHVTRVLNFGTTSILYIRHSLAFGAPRSILFGPHVTILMSLIIETIQIVRHVRAMSVQGNLAVGAPRYVQRHVRTILLLTGVSIYFSFPSKVVLRLVLRVPYHSIRLSYSAEFEGSSISAPITSSNSAPFALRPHHSSEDRTISIRWI